MAGSFLGLGPAFDAKPNIQDTKRYIQEGNLAHAEAEAKALKTKVVISVEFESYDPIHDSGLVLEFMKDGIPTTIENHLHVRYTTTHPEE